MEDAGGSRCLAEDVFDLLQVKVGQRRSATLSLEKVMAAIHEKLGGELFTSDVRKTAPNTNLALLCGHVGGLNPRNYGHSGSAEYESDVEDGKWQAEFQSAPTKAEGSDTLELLDFEDPPAADSFDQFDPSFFGMSVKRESDGDARDKVAAQREVSTSAACAWQENEPRTDIECGAAGREQVPEGIALSSDEETHDFTVFGEETNPTDESGSAVSDAGAEKADGATPPPECTAARGVLVVSFADFRPEKWPELVEMDNSIGAAIWAATVGFFEGSKDVLVEDGFSVAVGFMLLDGCDEAMGGSTATLRGALYAAQQLLLRRGFPPVEHVLLLAGSHNFTPQKCAETVVRSLSYLCLSSSWLCTAKH